MAPPRALSATQAAGRAALYALVGGSLAGSVAMAVQRWSVLQLILDAEAFEGAADAAAPTPAANGTGMGGAMGEEEMWEPGGARNLCTWASDMIMGCGYGLLLLASAVLRGERVSANSGGGYGLCGFFAFQFLPALGLAPELPAMVAADIVARQLWWTARVALVSLGLFLWFLPPPMAAALTRTADEPKARQLARALAALVLIVMLAVPTPEHPKEHGPVPAELEGQFVGHALFSTLCFWLALGSAIGALLERDKAMCEWIASDFDFAAPNEEGRELEEKGQAVGV